MQLRGQKNASCIVLAGHRVFSVCVVCPFVPPMMRVPQDCVATLAATDRHRKESLIMYYGIFARLRPCTYVPTSYVLCLCKGRQVS